MHYSISLSDLTLVYTHSFEYFNVDEYSVRNRKTHYYEIVSKDSESVLGTISWHGPWRKFVLNTIDDVIFDYKCLNALADFLCEITKSYKHK